MLIDEPTTLRNSILKRIPLPEDKDIIIYNKNFLELIDKDVQELYNSNLEVFKTLNKEYLNLCKEKKECEDFINNLSLVNKSYDENAYVKKIQELETVYAKKFAKIKSIEKRISIYENRVSELNRKIDNQNYLEQKYVNEQKEKNIELLRKDTVYLGELETCAKFFTDYYNEYGYIIKILDEEIDFEQKKLKKCLEENTNCKECGKKIYPSAKKIQANIDKLQARLEKHTEKCIELKEKRDNYRKQLSKLKKEISSLKEQIQMSDYSYTKKSEETLKLESAKFKVFDEINDLQNELKQAKETEGKEYERLKLQIEVYKTSLENYLEARRISKRIREIQEKLKPIQEKMNDYKDSLELYTEFLDIKYKVYEKNLNVFFENRVKLKLFERDGLYFKKVCKIKFDNIDILYLNPKQSKELNSFIVKKLRTLNGGEKDI